MHNIKIKQGKSNIIRFDAQKSNGTLLRKFFAEKLVCYETKWPLSRMDVEIAIHEKISFLLKNDTNRTFLNMIGVPSIQSVDREKHFFTMEYIEGQTIWNLFSNQYDDVGDIRSLPSLLKKEHFQALVRILLQLQKIELDDFPEDTQMHFQNQKCIVECMFKNKIKNQLPIPEEPNGVLCLGDLSLNNILFDGKKLYLIDFECAHFGYSGYDLGQLLGMSKAYQKRVSLFQPIYNNMNEAIHCEIKDSGLLNNIMMWKNIFCDYYNYNP